jgi:hypothetical protein
VVALQDESASSPPAPSAPAALRRAPERPIQTLIFVDTGGTHIFDRRDVCDELERYVRASGSGNEMFLVGRFDGEGMVTASSWTRDVAAVAARFTSSAMNRRRADLSSNSIPPDSVSTPGGRR